MTDRAGGYNNGSYDLRQQTFCLSMLTCLSFILTGRSAESITRRFRSSVENVLNHEASRELIGPWRLVWGPVVHADCFVGAKTSVNSLFIAAPEAHPEQVVIAIAGTNGNSLIGWMLQDFNVKEKVAWPYGRTTLKPHISKGIAYGLSKLQVLGETGGGDSSPLTIRDYLKANPSITRIMVTGHSLGGALAPVLALYLENTRAEWDRSGGAIISCLTTAGQTPGDQDFSAYYGETLGSTTERVWNTLDIVPYVYQKDMLLQVPALYEPDIPPQEQVESLVASIHREVIDNQYLNVLPEAAGFSSSFMTLEDVAGNQYKTFTDFINRTVGLVKKAAPFGARRTLGTIGFVVHALLQHLFPYFRHFEVDDFIKIMCSPVARPTPPPRAEGSLFRRVKAVFTGGRAN